jgi:hypothetical protein
MEQVFTRKKTIISPRHGRKDKQRKIEGKFEVLPLRKQSTD